MPIVDGRLPRLPEGLRVYAIGDVHGRIDLLRRLEERIAQDIAAGGHAQPILVYLGDYVDRGFESRAVLDHLTARRHDGLQRVMLLGNHDVWLREFWRGAEVADNWLRFGGDATLVSYGIRLDLERPEPERFAEARNQLRQRIPASHIDFLERLELGFSLGDYFFCHAGIRPGVPFGQQIEQDLIWIREPFLSWMGDHGKIVVHGHTVETRPIVRPNRIGIDTGACFTGNLTCLVLEGESQRFFGTAATAG